MTTKEHEHTLNIWLADALKRRGLNAKGESSHTGNRRIDVEVRIGQVVVVVEAKQGQNPSKRADAIRSADLRLDQHLANCAVAVCYPDATTQDSIESGQYIWQVRDGSALSADEGWTSGSLDQLASVIRLAPAQLGDPDYAAASLSDSLDTAVRRLDTSQKQMLASALDLPASKGSRVRRAHDAQWDKAAKRALLVVATAVMFHSRLDSHLVELRPKYDNRVQAEDGPVRFTGEWPPEMAHLCVESAAPISAFDASWNLILALDYKPIFETARAAVRACPPNPSFADAISDTARAALAVSQNIASLRHDLLGRIFHTVLDTARYDGSFYTTTAAATLLATLAIREDMCDWNNPEDIAGLRITDPACGTGTLLMAAAERIHDLAPRSRDDGEVAGSLIERVLSGYDVNVTATHMAATTLGLLSPTTRFQNMKIGRAFLGVDDVGDAYLGSLEFLDQQPKMMAWPDAAQTISQIDSGELMTQTDPADLVIMNPPFTRDSLRHDQFSRVDEKKMKDREKQIFANKPVHLSSIGSAFLVLADYMRKTDTGAIAAIMPLVAATNKSGYDIRRFLGRNYHVEYIITSHDPDRIYFSENTNIGEMLLVCRAWRPAKGQKPPTKVVNLAQNPSTPSDAISTAWAIENGTVTSQGYGTVQEVDSSRIEAGGWGAVQFFSPYLCQRFSELARGSMFPAVALGDIAAIGPAGQRIREAFRRTSMPDAEGRIALWQHDTAVTQSMLAKPDTHIVSVPKYAHRADNYWAQRSRLLLPTHLRLNTIRVVTVRLENPVASSLWVPCRPSVPENALPIWEKALGVFLNSSIGVLALLGDRTNKIPTRPNLSLDDLRRLIVPDFANLSENVVRRLSTAYDELAEATLLPLPQMNADPIRQELDAVVCATLDLDPELVSTIRGQLASEPSVTGDRYMAHNANSPIN